MNGLWRSDPLHPPEMLRPLRRPVPLGGKRRTRGFVTDLFILGKNIRHLDRGPGFSRSSDCSGMQFLISVPSDLIRSNITILSHSKIGS